MELALASPRIVLPRLSTKLRSSVALMTCALMLSFSTGCTQTEVKNAAATIANDIPTVETYISTAATVAATLEPGVGLIITGANAVVNTALTEIGVLLKAYADAPSPTTWGSIVEAVNTIVNTNASALLTAMQISDPASRARAIEVMGAIQTALLLLYTVIQNVTDSATKATVKAQAVARTVKLSQYKDALDKHQVEVATGHSFNVAYNYEVSLGF